MDPILMSKEIPDSGGLMRGKKRPNLEEIMIISIFGKSPIRNPDPDLQT